MSYVLGVDGGNTKTIACIAALDGSIIGFGRGGCGDIYNSMSGQSPGLTGSEVALANIEDAVTQALQTAQIQSSELLAGVFNMAGADWPEDFALLHAAMQARNFGQTIHVQNDALGVLHAGSLENIGVSVISGSGLAIGARGPAGRSWHGSFWLHAGGSYLLSRHMLDRVYRSELGLEPPTSLTARTLSFFGMETVEEVLHFMTNRKTQITGFPRIDGLTPLLLDEAEGGDQVARDVLLQHGQEIGDYAVVAARKVGIEQLAFPLVLAGGVLRHNSELLLTAIVERVRKTSPQVQPTRSPFEPIIGTLFTAFDIVGTPITEAIRERLLTTHPGATLFETRSDALLPHTEI